MEKDTWTKSSFSGPDGRGCVEVMQVDEGVMVRHSRRRGADMILYAHGVWEAFDTRSTALEYPMELLLSVVAGQHATPEQAAEIRQAFISTGAVHKTAGYADSLAKRASSAIDDIGLAAPATEYLHDLVRLRITWSLNVLTERVKEHQG